MLYSFLILNIGITWKMFAMMLSYLSILWSTMIQASFRLWADNDYVLFNNSLWNILSLMWKTCFAIWKKMFAMMLSYLSILWSTMIQASFRLWADNYYMYYLAIPVWNILSLMWKTCFAMWKNVCYDVVISVNPMKYNDSSFYLTLSRHLLFYSYL